MHFYQIDKNIAYIAAVTHARSGAVVERFKYVFGEDFATHYETVSSPLLHSPNGK